MRLSEGPFARTRYRVTVHTSPSTFVSVLCDEVDLDEKAGTLTVYGFKNLSHEMVNHRVFMLRNVLYYDVMHVQVEQ